MLPDYPHTVPSVGTGLHWPRLVEHSRCRTRHLALFYPRKLVNFGMGDGTVDQYQGQDEVRDVTSRAANCHRELLYRVRHKKDAKTGCSFSYANDCKPSCSELQAGFQPTPLRLSQFEVRKRRNYCRETVTQWENRGGVTNFIIFLLLRHRMYTNERRRSSVAQPKPAS